MLTKSFRRLTGLISVQGGGHCDPRFTDVRLSKVPQLESVSVRIVSLRLQRVMQRGFRKHLIPMHTCLKLTKRFLLRGGITTRMRRSRYSLWCFISEPPGLGAAPSRAAAEKPAALYSLCKRGEPPPLTEDSRQEVWPQLNGNARKQVSETPWLLPIIQASRSQDKVAELAQWDGA